MALYENEICGVPYFPGVASGHLQKGANRVNAQSIVLLSQDAITAFPVLPAGFIVTEAAPFSHTLIALLGLGVPTVLITARQAASLKQGVLLQIDGSSGKISSDIAEVSPAALSRYGYNRQDKAGSTFLMADGEAVNLCASVRRLIAVNQAVAQGATCIGLVRSEFLLPMNGRQPNQPFYRETCRELCEAAAPLTVTFRLLDLAADKIPGWLPKSAMTGQAAGLQGVRLYHIDSVRTVVDAQLAALADLSGEFVFRLLLPFLVRPEEYVHWLSVIRQYLPDTVAVGAMAETPAAVLDIGGLLEQANFVAIGCNDLMQGLFSADRDQPALRHYLDPYAPVLYRLLRQAAEQAGRSLPGVQLCGVLSQLQGVLPVLLGLGYRTFSIDAPFIPYFEQVIAASTQTGCEALAAQVCAAASTYEVLEILQLPTDRHPPYLA